MGYTKTIASFFSGYGGLEMGIRSALGGECRTIVFVEREAYAVANLVAKIEAGQLDAAPIHTDVTTFPYRKFRGLVDIACGGVPCQPHSVAGKRKGGNDERFLFDAFFDGLEEMQPGQIFIENVEGLLTSRMPDGSLCFKYIIERLEKMDYRVEAGLFTAAEVGAPHRRKRVFILAQSHNARSWDNSEQARCESRGEVVRQGNGEERAVRIDAAGASPELGHSRQFSARNQIRRFGEGSTSSEEIVGAVKGDRFTDSSKIMGNANKPRPQGRDSGELQECTVKWPARPGSPQYDWEEPRVTQR